MAQHYKQMYAPDASLPGVARIAGYFHRNFTMREALDIRSTNRELRAVISSYPHNFFRDKLQWTGTAAQFFQVFPNAVGAKFQNFTDDDAFEIERHPRFKHLALREADTTELTEEGFNSFRNLESFALTWNASAYTDAAFANLTNLIYLDISNATALLLTPAAFANFRRLEKLHANYLQLSDAFFVNLPRLQFLNVSNNMVMTDEAFRNLPRLISLNITGCRNITSAAFRLIGANLTELYMNNSPIGDEIFAALPHLRKLSIVRCARITNAAFQYFGNLIELDMSYCENVTDAGLANLVNIKKLGVEGCLSLTDDIFSRFVGIDYLNVANCYQLTGKSWQYLKTVKMLKWDYRLNI